MSDATLKIGRYIVRIGLRRDNPSFPVYLVFLGDRLIGRQFSVPSLSDCDWIERQANYAAPSKRPRRHSSNTDGVRWAKNATKPEPA
jgi:hypothetical protein